MVISNLKGGLGNQMFEFSAGYVLAKERNTDFKLDLTHLRTKEKFQNETPREFQLDFFNISVESATEQEIFKVKKQYSRGLLPILKLDSYLIMLNIVKYPLLARISSDIYMDGYFQNEEYFQKYEKDIRKMFSLKVRYLTKDFVKMCDEIKRNFDNSVSIHIRRGDYVTNTQANKWHGLLRKDYYYNAIEYIKNKQGVEKPYIYVFSDDSKWVKENMSFGGNVTYISEDFNPAQAIILMSNCKNNIIANSSFSWWGAWLNPNKEKIVIAPERWLAGSNIVSRGIVPKGWVRFA
jgi:hypothetical protein